MGKRRLVGIAVALLPVLVIGCSRGREAETALLSAEDAIRGIRPVAQEFAPDQFSALTEAATDARAKFEAGDYSAAQKIAATLPSRTNEVMAAAASAREELTTEWKTLEDSVPPMLSRLTQTFADLSARKKLPTGIDAARLEALWTQLADITTTWTRATKAYDGRKLNDAVKAGQDAADKASELTMELDAVVGHPSR